jgi:hypothetical protein
MPRTSLLAAAGLLTSLAAFASVLPAQEIKTSPGDQPFDWSGEVPAGSWLRVRSVNGPIEVTEARGSTVEVHAEASQDGRHHPEDLVYVVRRDGDDITICAMYRDRSECDDRGMRTTDDRDSDRESHNARTHITVKLPRDVKLVAESGNGAISVDGATADVRVGSGNGRVTVHGGSRVDASTGNGEVDVTDATAPVKASTGNGKIQVATAAGPVSASTGNGDIIARMGRLTGDSDMHFSTGNGDVRLTLPSDFQAEVETSMGMGSIDSQFPLTLAPHSTRYHMRGTIGNGGRRVTMSSGNGDLVLRKAGSDDRN